MVAFLDTIKSTGWSEIHWRSSALLARRPSAFRSGSMRKSGEGEGAGDEEKQPET